MDQIAAVLKTYNYFNPTTTRAAGVFRDKSLQALYNTLIAQGSVDVAAAMQVGRDIENLDIKDLQVMLKSTMPAELLITAETSDGIVMGVRHRDVDVEGVQFHPESILTASGHGLLSRFLQRCN